MAHTEVNRCNGERSPIPDDLKFALLIKPGAVSPGPPVSLRLFGKRVVCLAHLGSQFFSCPIICDAIRDALRV